MILILNAGHGRKSCRIAWIVVLRFAGRYGIYAASIIAVSAFNTLRVYCVHCIACVTASALAVRRRLHAALILQCLGSSSTEHILEWWTVNSRRSLRWPCPQKVRHTFQHQQLRRRLQDRRFCRASRELPCEEAAIKVARRSFANFVNRET